MDLTIIAEAYKGNWQLAEPMEETGITHELPNYLAKIEGYLENYGHYLKEDKYPTHQPINLWGGRDTKLQNDFLNAIKNYGLPEDCSKELSEYYENFMHLSPMAQVGAQSQTSPKK